MTHFLMELAVVSSDSKVNPSTKRAKKTSLNSDTSSCEPVLTGWPLSSSSNLKMAEGSVHFCADKLNRANNNCNSEKTAMSGWVCIGKRTFEGVLLH